MRNEFLMHLGTEMKSKEPHPQSGASEPFKQCGVDLVTITSLDQIGGDFVFHHPCKIPFLLSFSSPQLLQHFRRFLKYFAGIKCHSHLLNLKSLEHLRKNPSRSIPYILSFDPFPICGIQKMIYSVINSMSSSLDTLGISYTTFHLC